MDKFLMELALAADLLSSSSDRMGSGSAGPIQVCARDLCGRGPFLDPNIQTEVRLTDQLLSPMGDLPFQHMVSISYHPYQMVLDLVDGVRPASVTAHQCSGEARSPWKTSLTRRYGLHRPV
jgi:hypothetical protein